MSSEIEKVVVELLPCPHCGGAAEFKRDTSSGTVYVQCSRMDCGGEWCNEADAASFWNRRTPPSSATPGERGIATGDTPTFSDVWSKLQPIERAIISAYFIESQHRPQPQERAGSDAGAWPELRVVTMDSTPRDTWYAHGFNAAVALCHIATRPQPASDALETAPIGTKAPAIGGGWWCRVPTGWKWNGPDGNGGTFPRPGGDWSGQLIQPASDASGENEATP